MRSEEKIEQAKDWAAAMREIAGEQTEEYLIMHSLERVELMRWLIGQAKILGKIADTWISIEENGTPEDASNFYTFIQNILAGDSDD